MVVKAKSGNLNMSASSPAVGKKRKSVSGQWDVAGKDEGPTNGKTPQKTPLKKNAGNADAFNSAKATPKNEAVEMQKRDSIGSGGPTPKKQKTGPKNGTPGPKKRNNESTAKTPQSQKKIKKEKVDEEMLNDSTATSTPTPKKKKWQKTGVKPHKGPLAKKSENAEAANSQSPRKSENAEGANKQSPKKNKAASSSKEVEKKPFVKQNAFPGWTAGELLQLVGRIEDTSSALLNVETTEVNDKINWKSVAFGDHSPEDCKTTWLSLVDKSRRTRELIDEARKMLVEKIPKECLELKTVHEKVGKVNKKEEEEDDEDEEDEEMEQDEEEQEGSGEEEAEGGEGEESEEGEDEEEEDDEQEVEGEEEEEEGDDDDGEEEGDDDDDEEEEDDDEEDE